MLNHYRSSVRRSGGAGSGTMYGLPSESELAYEDTSTVSNYAYPLIADALLPYKSKSRPRLSEDFALSRETAVFEIGYLATQLLYDTATMAGTPRIQVVELESVEPYARGLSIVRMPREAIETDEAVIRTAEIPRKRPRVVLSDRAGEGFDA